MDIKKLALQLEELEKKYREWVLPIEEFNSSYVDKLQEEENIPEEYYTDLKIAEEKQKSISNPHVEIYNFLDQLCLVYYDSKPHENEEIREIVNKNKGILNCLLGYALRAVTLLDKYPDIELLRMGLVALSIENCSTNYSKTENLLNELYHKGNKLNIDSEKEFIKISFISSNRISEHGKKSFKILLKDTIIQKNRQIINH